MSPAESFEEIARQLERASEALEATPHDVRAVHLELVGCIASAHTHAILSASWLRKREASGALFAMPAPTETRQ